MNASRRAGFTLIELLTVIAIIAILAAMVFTIGPRMIEKAKKTRMENALKQVNTALFAYLSDTKLGSYPPAYGYVGPRQGPTPPTDQTKDETYYHQLPYMALIKLHGQEKIYDEFSESYDTDRDGQLSLLEFGPVGQRTPLGGYTFDARLPRYSAATASYLGVELQRQMEAKKRPFIYVPVNRAQAKRAGTYWIKNGDFLANTWNTAAPELQNMAFPPAKYDAFVLIGVGPFANTFGLVKDPPFLAQIPARDAYHIAALRTYFLATRDMNANGKLDFDFTARTTEGEGKLTYTVPAAGDKPCDNKLPCDTPDNAGPYIYVSQ